MTAVSALLHDNPNLSDEKQLRLLQKSLKELEVSGLNMHLAHALRKRIAHFWAVCFICGKTLHTYRGALICRRHVGSLILKDKCFEFRSGRLVPRR